MLDKGRRNRKWPRPTETGHGVNPPPGLRQGKVTVCSGPNFDVPSRPEAARGPGSDKVGDLVRGGRRGGLRRGLRQPQRITLKPVRRDRIAGRRTRTAAVAVACDLVAGAEYPTVHGGAVRRRHGGLRAVPGRGPEDGLCPGVLRLPRPGGPEPARRPAPPPAERNRRRRSEERPGRGCRCRSTTVCPRTRGRSRNRCRRRRGEVRDRFRPRRGGWRDGWRYRPVQDPNTGTLNPAGNGVTGRSTPG